MNVMHNQTGAYPTQIPHDQGAFSSLLISVSEWSEAQSALSVGVDVLDFKRPSLGPLGPVNPDLWKLAAEENPASLLSAALGEKNQARECVDHLPVEFDFAKVGLSDVRSVRSLNAVWDEFQERLSGTTELVAVAYADHVAANSLSVEQIFCVAKERNMRWLLIDTFQKRGRSSIQSLGWRRMGANVVRAKLNEQFITIAGSVRCTDVREFVRHQVQPHAIGIRGDVCVGGRAGRMDVGKVMRWRNELADRANG